MDVPVNPSEGLGLPRDSGEVGGFLHREASRESAAGGNALGQGRGAKPGGSAVYGTYAGFWQRAGALLLDVLFLWGFLSLLHALDALLGRVPSFLGDVILWVGYFVAATSLFGGTLGKLAVGIRVVDETGRKPPFGAVFLRETAGKLTSTFFWGLGFLMAAWDDHMQALHDRMARTYVVSIPSDDAPSAG
ncbi:RDD family protein [Brockia lithotrophica]|uniref:Putative RDD family membrane protein YckC n=1 Tax=Brockia lithotrophica TaxID=933949 RepID=A0A660KWP5_9BACL|nr:RDD family protein [Brockia lithotrophica]RKQ84148.1 putative RDD family membrane protein YckC [Brockia lithotrophica]